MKSGFHTSRCEKVNPYIELNSELRDMQMFDPTISLHSVFKLMKVLCLEPVMLRFVLEKHSEFLV